MIKQKIQAKCLFAKMYFFGLKFDCNWVLHKKYKVEWLQFGIPWKYLNYLFKRNNANAKLNQMHTNPSFFCGGVSRSSTTSNPAHGWNYRCLKDYKKITYYHSSKSSKTAKYQRVLLQLNFHPKYCESSCCHSWFRK